MSQRETTENAEAKNQEEAPLKDLEAADTEEVKGGGKGISKIVIDN